MVASVGALVSGWSYNPSFARVLPYLFVQHVLSALFLVFVPLSQQGGRKCVHWLSFAFWQDKLFAGTVYDSYDYYNFSHGFRRRSCTLSRGAR